MSKNIDKNYDVIIVGGGPTGVALAMELGLHQVKTLILEKHAAPLLSPRAQSLNARSMEFFRRWHLADALKTKSLFPDDYPLQGVWCSQLNGKTYAVISSNDALNDEMSPERGVRIPLWLTEEVIRQGLKSFPHVTLLKSLPAIDVQQNTHGVTVTAKNAESERLEFHAPYVVGCDGANSLTRQKIGLSFKQLADPQRVINIVFESGELAKHISVDKGFLYYLLESKRPGALGLVDPARGLWYAQVKDDGKAESIDQVSLDAILQELTGFSFKKTIVDAHFWNMHIQLADGFSKNEQVFLVGDSVHAFVPTGGLGLNTGLGDAVNLGWKLASVIKHNAKPSLLTTYEIERQPVCLRNLLYAQKNATDMMALRMNCDPKMDPEGFAKANADLAKQFVLSLGLTMGYAYFDSKLTHLAPSQPTQEMDASSYTPSALPGYFLPHYWLQKNHSIYDKLSSTAWTLIVSEGHTSKTAVFENVFKSFNIPYEILHLPKNAYPNEYLLIRPDWHIAMISNEPEKTVIENYFQAFYIKS